jgi:hypothetical protein
VGTGVGEVLALQIYRMPDTLAEALCQIEGSRTADEVTTQVLKPFDERWVIAGFGPGGNQLVQRRNEGFGNVATTVRAEAARG